MTQTRRDFLKTSAAVGSGLILGFYLPLSRAAGSAAMADGMAHQPNIWVRISPDNTITLICARSEMGQGVYTALPMLIAEELQVDVHRVKVVIAPPDPVYKNAMLGAQITGGSTSVRDGWDKMRIGGAQARMMLVAAAAQSWKIDAAGCRVQDGYVFGPSGKKASYGKLAGAAAKLPVPTNVVLKNPSEFTQIGRPTKRLDTPSKVNGTAQFGIDVKLPGMVYASLEQCPVIGGKVVSFDATKARAMPGVIDVVQINDGVAVVANTYWRAYKARQALDVKWDEGPVAQLDNAVMMDGIAQAAASEKILNIAKTGDVDGAMKGAAKTLKVEYHSPMLAHATLEPQNFTAHYANGKCLLIGPTQFQQGAVGNVATALGIKPEDITLKTTFIGGGFGRRLEVDFIVQAAQISKAVGKPVKLLWSREDDTTHDFVRPLALHRMEGGLDASGKPVALTFQLTSQSITQRAFGTPKDTLDPFMTEAAVVPYAIPNMRQDVINHDAGLRVGYWRSVSHALNAFANESFIDEMATAAGKDPYQFRVDLLAPDSRLANVAKLARDKAGWGTALPAGHARGVAFMDGYESHFALVLEVSKDGDDITVHRAVVAADIGQMVNPDTVEAQIQSSLVFGLSAALADQVTLVKGRVQQRNFDSYPVLRIQQMPQVDVILVKSTEKPGGVGEPVTAMVAPALGNALFVLTGKRAHQLPFTAENLAKA